MNSIAFPAISCGVYGYPIAEACRIALETTAAFLRENPLPARVVFVLFSAADFQVYLEGLERLRAASV